MFENKTRRPWAALAGGLLGLLVLTGCAGAPRNPTTPAGERFPETSQEKRTTLREMAGGPAATLQADRYDAPIETSVQDAQRSAEMAEEMTGAPPGGQGGHGGHAGHGASGAYTHKDPGRTSSMESMEEETVYACPMHPDVTSKTPGTCSICGMTLVQRRTP